MPPMASVARTRRPTKKSSRASKEVMGRFYSESRGVPPATASADEQAHCGGHRQQHERPAKAGHHPVDQALLAVKAQLDAERDDDAGGEGDRQPEQEIGRASCRERV